MNPPGWHVEYAHPSGLLTAICRVAHPHRLGSDSSSKWIDVVPHGLGAGVHLHLARPPLEVGIDPAATTGNEEDDREHRRAVGARDLGISLSELSRQA